MNVLCIVVVAAYGIVIAGAIVKSRKDKKELKELDERLKSFLN